MALTSTGLTDVGSVSTRLLIVLAAAPHEEAATVEEAAAVDTAEAMVVVKEVSCGYNDWCEVFANVIPQAMAAVVVDAVRIHRFQVLNEKLT